MNISSVNVSDMNIRGMNVRRCECKWYAYKWCEHNCDVNINVVNVSDGNGYCFKC